MGPLYNLWVPLSENLSRPPRPAVLCARSPARSLLWNWLKKKPGGSGGAEPRTYTEGITGAGAATTARHILYVVNTGHLQYVRFDAYIRNTTEPTNRNTLQLYIANYS